MVREGTEGPLKHNEGEEVQNGTVYKAVQSLKIINNDGEASYGLNRGKPLSLRTWREDVVTKSWRRSLQLSEVAVWAGHEAARPADLAGRGAQQWAPGSSWWASPATVLSNIATDSVIRVSKAEKEQTEIMWHMLGSPSHERFSVSLSCSDKLGGLLAHLYPLIIHPNFHVLRTMLKFPSRMEKPVGTRGQDP